MRSNRCGFPLFWALGLVPLLINMASAEEDTSLRLNQSIEQRSVERESELLKNEQGNTSLPTLVVNGREYTVEGDVNAMGRALYTAVQQKQWPAVLSLLNAYKALPGADAMLVAYAEGGVSRVQGNLAEAEAHYRQLLDLKQDFLPGQLELARVLFEDHKNVEAQSLFDHIHQGLSPERERTSGVRNTVDTFLQALDERDSWQGKIAFGPSYDDNLNRSSESYTCLIPAQGGGCFFDRKVPDAISAPGLNYEATLEKNISLAGHHNLFVRGLAFGDSYQDYHEYNESSLTASGGYRYRSARHMMSIAPQFEQRYYGNRALYQAWGARAEWMRYVSRKTALRLEGDFKELDYRPEFAHYDGTMSSLFATAWHAVNTQWSVFGGVDLVDRHSKEAVYAYEQVGARVGVSRRFQSGFSAVLFSAFRLREHDEFSALLEARRRDKEQNHTLILEAPRLAFAGFTPTLTLSHSRVSSNVDWLYSYSRNSVSLKLEHRF
ncbi:surface lipoprotein assembly modifier [Marinimicrobium sp. ARAG 43.8]|uniref:surface lipoprotein assembly modifier n=1 Tax=Marinimicrobium sp. ARAG 43.8 TaxID=3418719 RepID=UPI003CF419A0